MEFYEKIKKVFFDKYYDGHVDTSAYKFMKDIDNIAQEIKASDTDKTAKSAKDTDK